MKKQNKRLLSALLAFVLLMTSFPVIGAASGAFAITYEGEVVSQVEFYEHERIAVAAENNPESGYQWQIKIPETDQWVNIQGQNAQTIQLSKAVVGSLSVNGVAYVRCAATSNGEETDYTDDLCVTVKEAEPVVQIPVAQAPAAVVVPEPVPTEPVPAETAAPAEETEAPVEETEAPVEETEAPVEETEAPVEETEAPVEETEAPVEETEAPIEETEAPIEETEAPTEEIIENTEASTEAEDSEKQTIVEKITQFFAPSTTVNDSADNSADIVTITIHFRAIDRNYKFVKTQENANDVAKAAEAEPAVDPYVAHIFSGSDLKTTIPCHVIAGCKLILPSYYNNDQTGVQIDSTNKNNLFVNLTNVTTDRTFYIYYQETKVSYTARYFMQNVYNDLYVENSDILTQEIRDQMKGYPGDQPNPSIIYPDVEGFTALFFQPDSIAADGSTIFEVYYDRNYYLMNFNMDGGFGTAPVYARYGTAFTAANPVKSGWSFGGWELEKVNSVAATEEQKQQPFPTTIPTENRTYKAKWIQGDTEYTVLYWILNDQNTDDLSDDITTFLGSCKYNADTGTSISGSHSSHSLTTTLPICGKDHNSHEKKCYVDGVAFRHMDFVKADQNVTIEGDGSSVVNVYYEYREYTLKFYYARTTGGTDGDDEDTIPDSNFSSIEVVGGTTWYFGSQGYSSDTSNDATLLSEVNDWGSIQSFPQLKRNQDVYQKGALQANGYLYHYISFNARYNDSIEDLWPCDVIAPATRTDVTDQEWTGTTAYVSAWNGEHRVAYSRNNSNPTIKGLQERLSEELLFHEKFTDETEVSYLCFWENGAKIGWSVPELYIYNIWVPCLKNKSENAPIDPATGETAQTRVYNGTCYYLKQSYHTCDNSNIASQTVPSLTGYTYRETEWGAIFLSQTTKSESVYTGKGDKKAKYNENTQTLYDADDAGSSWEVGQSLQIVRQTDGTYLLYDESLYDPNNLGTDVNHNVYREAYFRDYYYTSNTKTLYFWNYDGNLDHGGGVQLAYDTPLKMYGDYVNADYMHGVGNDPYTGEPFTSHYPSKLEPNAYYFDGWFTTTDCVPGTEMDWNRKMPDSDLTVYAKWEPVEYKTYFYMDYVRYQEGTSFFHTENTPHGSKIIANLNPIRNLKFTGKDNVENEDYLFVNWFYIDTDGSKKAFNPHEMAVRKELHLFAEWTSTEVKEYTVSYQMGKEVETDGKKTIVAANPIVTMAKNSEGYALEATTKTFTALAMSELTNFPADNTEGQLWLPHTNSHSIIMQSNNDENVFTFYYITKEKAPYTVRYLDATTNEPVHEEISYPDNKDAVVTVPFQYISGYIPDAFHKRLVLSANDEENVVTFYYTKDDSSSGGDVGGGDTPGQGNARYLIVHHYAGLGTDPEELVEEDCIGAVGSNVTATAQSIPGFEFDEDRTKDAILKDDQWTLSGFVTSGADTDDNKPLELHLYYKRGAYEYQVKYCDWDTKAPLTEKETTKNKAPFETLVSVKAEPISGYDLYAADADGTKTQTLTISWNEESNVITFYYIKKKVSVEYVAVCTDSSVTSGFGGVSNPLDYGQNTPTGSTAKPASGYSFTGWYTGWGTQGQTLITPNAVLQSDHIQTTADVYDYTYYAVFEPITLTINQTGMNDGDSAVYEVVKETNVIARVMLTGNCSATIQAIPADRYTVRVSGNWAWTYTTPAKQTVMINDASATVTFDHSAKTPICWLHSETHQ